MSKISQGWSTQQKNRKKCRFADMLSWSNYTMWLWSLKFFRRTSSATDRQTNGPKYYFLLITIKGEIYDDKWSFLKAIFAGISFYSHNHISSFRYLHFTVYENHPKSLISQRGEPSENSLWIFALKISHQIYPWDVEYFWHENSNYSKINCRIRAIIVRVRKFQRDIGGDFWPLWILI